LRGEKSQMASWKRGLGGFDLKEAFASRFDHKCSSAHSHLAGAYLSRRHDKEHARRAQKNGERRISDFELKQGWSREAQRIGIGENQKREAAVSEFNNCLARNV
jgi:hypothetical protein